MSENNKDFSSDAFGSAADDSSFIGNVDEILKSFGIEPISSESYSAESDKYGADSAFSLDNTASFSGKTYEKIPFTPSESVIESETSKEDGFFSGGKFAKKNTAPPEEQYAHSAQEQAQILQQKKKSKFRKNFRVLSKEVQDETIYERHDDTQGRAFADSLNDDEDIFRAADEAKKGKKNKGVFSADGKSAASMKKAAKTKRQKEVIVSAGAMQKELVKKLKRQKVQILFLVILLIVSFALYCLPSFYAVSNPLEFMFSDGGLVYGLINIACLVLGAAVSFDRIADALKSLKNLSIGSSVGLLLTVIFVLMHSVYTITAGISGLAGNDLYTLYGIFACLLSVVSENLKCKTAYRNIAVVRSSTAIDSVNTVDNSADGAVLARGVTKKGKENVLYCAAADTVKSLRADLGLRSDENKFYPVSYIAMILAAVVCGIIMALRNNHAAFFMTGIIACLCLCGPTVCEFSRMLLLYKKNKQLNNEGGAVLDFKGVEQMGKANGVAMDISDIFTAEVFRFSKAKGARIPKEHSAIYVTSILKNSGSLLYDGFFKEIEDNLMGELPLGENVRFFPGAGFEGDVNSKKVLVGNRRLLLKNGIEPVPEALEQSKCKGNSFYYVIVDGEITAYFFVKYNVRGSIKKSSSAFNKTGLMLLLTSKEPDLTEKLISSKLDVDVSAVKLMDDNACDLMEEYRRNRSMRQHSSLVCARRKKFIFNLTVWAQRLYDADKILVGMNVSGQMIFFALMIAAVFMNITVFSSPIAIIMIQCLWSAASVLVGTIKK